LECLRLEAWRLLRLMSLEGLSRPECQRLRLRGFSECQEPRPGRLEAEAEAEAWRLRSEVRG
jgi:hypothetical protein